MGRRHAQAGHTLMELLVALGIAALLLAGLQQALFAGAASKAEVEAQTAMARDARFAMVRMEDAVRGGRLLVPFQDMPATSYDESLRAQTVPASPPQPGSAKDTAVLAVTLDRRIDLDGDGTFDADDDGDGRFDEDLPADAQFDGKPGLAGFDDDGNGTLDFVWSPDEDDDESNDFARDEDPLNGIDDDGDGMVDEDPGADMNGDGASGVVGVDDDGDGSIDEGPASDDDEDGFVDEDWWNPVVFYLQGSSLIERRPVPWDESGSGGVDGADFVETTIADNVTLLSFKRDHTPGRRELVVITLEMTYPDGRQITLKNRVRAGSWQ